MSSKKTKAITPASVIVFALSVTLLAASLTYIAVSTTLNIQASRNEVEYVSEKAKHHVRAYILAGTRPIGNSPRAWLLVHEESGTGDRLLDIIVDRDGNVRHVRPDRPIREGGCIMVRLDRHGLPKKVKDFANATVVVHLASGAVGKAYVNPFVDPDEIYPCDKDNPDNPRIPLQIKVRLDDGDRSTACGNCDEAVTPSPGTYQYDAYTTVRIQAAHNVTRSGKTYYFSHWEVEFIGEGGDEPEKYYVNPLPLFIDDGYVVTAVFRTR